MKKFHFNWILSIAFVSAMVLSACSSDPCKDVVCENGGVPVPVGDVCNCNCDDGYEGEFCEVESREKYVGTWTADENCDGTTDTYIVTITKGTGGVTEIRIANFWNEFNNAVIATVDEDDITIPNQEPDGDDFFVQGTGDINNDGTEITLNYTIKDDITGDTQTCTATLQ